ncbi:adenylyl cyclase-associated protein 1-like [Boleophthalmus pectinirostris]|uniref:adenylyl cyclase-associated protein 1-like n=1 Tax=Boleophthalmus pectinirostris TaxID=150288 RepID=UPI0024311E67|nr:adenylyl cyclase-associated protein 1-like [Boleophthalmus pectinirostris]
MAELAGLVARLEVAVGRLEGMSLSGGGGGGAASPSGGPVAKFVEEYDDIVSGAVAQYLSLSQKIGGDVQKHADMMKQGFAAVRQILVLASSHQKPSDVSTANTATAITITITTATNTTTTKLKKIY